MFKKIISKLRFGSCANKSSDNVNASAESEKNLKDKK